MGIKIQFGSSVIALPAAAAAMLDRASMQDVRVLFALSSEPVLCHTYGDAETVQKLSEITDCTPAELETSVAFWRGAGIILLENNRRVAAVQTSATVPPTSVTVETVKTQKASVPTKETQAPIASAAVTSEKVDAQPKAARHSELPRYTTEQLADLLEARRETAEYINECQRMWGKIFNTHDVNILLGLVDYLGLNWEYVLLLMSYCIKVQDKRGMARSLHYLEKTAFAFYDEGICDVPALSEKIRRCELMAETEGRLRTLFGMGGRSLTPREKKYFSAWLYEFGFGMDIIKLAYEVTVDAKGAPNMAYMNSVLANWNRDGIRTPEAVEADRTAHRAEQDARRSASGAVSRADGIAGKRTTAPRGAQSPNPDSTFDVNDFFEAAVRRSLGEDFVSTDGKNRT